MAVYCANCGEELIGSVNRCWKCGQTVLSTPAGGMPPVRTAAAKPASDVGATEAAVPETGVPASGVVVANLVDDQEAGATETPVVQRSSILSGIVARIRGTPPAHWLAVGSVLLGAITIVLGIFTGWAVILAAAGLGCGVAEIGSRKKSLAIVGMLICLLGLTVSSIRLTYDLFSFIRGETPVLIEPAPEDDYPLDPLDPLGDPELIE